MFNQKEIELWEQEQAGKVNNRYCTTKSTRLFDPKKERLFKARKRCVLKWFWGIETKDNRKEWQTHIRAVNKQRGFGEDAYHPTKREYHTGGYLTW